jgi:DNA modification methylase
MIRIEDGDCLEIIPRLADEGVVVDAVVTDPPYHLQARVSRFSKEGSAPPKHGRDGAMGRISRGFMGQEWDGGDIAFRPETWATLGSILRPGGIMLVFGGSRTYHRMACAIEDAGFVVQDSLMWLYGCLSEDTELVTPNGVTSYRKITVGDPVLCYDSKISEYSYQPVLEVVEYEYSDTAYRLIGDFGEQIVTRNHRCIVERDGREVFALAETLEQQACVPILESLSSLQSALYDLDCGAGEQEQNVRSQLRGGSTQRPQDFPAQAFIREEGSGYCLHSLRQGSLETRSVASESSETDVQLQVQRGAPGRGVDKTRLQITYGMVSRSKGQSCSQNDRTEQPGMEGRVDVSEPERVIRKSVDPVYPLSHIVSEYGAERRLRDGVSAFSCSRDGTTIDARRDRASPEPQSNGQRAYKFNVVCDERPAQGIRAWCGHKTAVVRVVPFHYTGKVWCLRVPTGAFVAVRNGVAFATGNSGFPKRRDQLKPAYEQICFAYKPGGARTVQIDECRVATNDKLGGGRTSSDWAGPAHKGWRRPLHDNPQKMAVRADISKARVQIAETQGRWPANVCHDGSDEVVELFPVKAGAVAPASGPKLTGRSERTCMAGHFNGTNVEPAFYGDTGSAARFFWSPKASKADRAGSAHPTIKPVALTEWLVRLVTPLDGTVLDAFAGSGVTGQAAAQSGRNAILIERQPQYVADIYRRLGMPFDL